MNFLADESVFARRVEALRRLGHDVVTAKDAGQLDADLVRMVDPLNG